MNKPVDREGRVRVTDWILSIWECGYTINKKKKKHNQGTYSGNKMSPNIPNTNRENISETGVKEKWNSHSSEVKRKKCDGG